MTDYLKSKSVKSLNAQIKELEQQIFKRQREVDVRTAILMEKIQRQIPRQIIVTPANLLLAGSIGFFLGELIQYRGSTHNNQPQLTGISVLKITQNLLVLTQTLYATLTLAWLMTSRYQANESSQIHNKD